MTTQSPTPRALATALLGLTLLAVGALVWFTIATRGMPEISHLF